MSKKEKDTEIKEVRKTSIGGQALLGGIMMKSPDTIAISVRMPDGTVKTEEEPYVPWTKKHKILQLPIIRGCVGFAESLSTGMKAMTKSAETIGIDETDEEPSKFEMWLDKKFGKNLEKVIMGIGMFLGIILSVGLFIMLPSWVASLFRPWATTAWATNLIEGVVRLLIFFAYLLLIAHTKGIRETFEYHGAEHKTIACYEHDLPLTVENTRKMSRLHPRCGTNYLFLVMMISIVVFSLIGYNGGNWMIKVGLRLLLIPVVAGISYEVLRIAGMYDNPVTRVIRWPGMQLQRITTVEPKDSQLAVAIESFEYALDADVAKEKAATGYYETLYKWTEEDQNALSYFAEEEKVEKDKKNSKANKETV